MYFEVAVQGGRTFSQGTRVCFTKQNNGSQTEPKAVLLWNRESVWADSSLGADLSPKSVRTTLSFPSFLGLATPTL